MWLDSTSTSVQAIERETVGALPPSQTVLPLNAVFSDAPHHLTLVSRAIEVLVAGTRLHCGQQLDDVSPTVLRALPDECSFCCPRNSYVVPTSEQLDVQPCLHNGPMTIADRRSLARFHHVP